MSGPTMRISIAIILGCSMLIWCAGAISFGIGPSEINFPDTVRGGVYERSASIFYNGDSPTTLTLTTTGSAADWIEFYSLDGETVLTEIDLDARATTPVLIRISIPSDASNGDYSATTVMVTKPVKSDTKEVGASVSLQATLLIKIHVTGTQVVSGTADMITVGDTEVNSPLQVTVLFRNTGNVMAGPDITLEIIKDAAVIDSVQQTGTSVQPEKQAIIPVTWSETNVEAGMYIARVTVGLGGTIIKQNSIDFEVFAPGTLTREGALVDLIYEGIPQKDGVVKIIGDFKNTGMIATRAKLIGEVFRNGVLVDTVSSEELIISVGSQDELFAYVPIRDSGTYRIDTYVVYEGKKTNITELDFDASSSGLAAGVINPVLTICAVALGLIIAIPGLRRKKEH
jgi:hypothetical protein